jgi:hypothetical protein
MRTIKSTAAVAVIALGLTLGLTACTPSAEELEQQHDEWRECVLTLAEEWVTDELEADPSADLEELSYDGARLAMEACGEEPGR